MRARAFVLALIVGFVVAPDRAAYSQCVSIFHGGGIADLNFVTPTNTGTHWNLLGSATGFWDTKCSGKLPALYRSTTNHPSRVNISVVRLTNGFVCDGQSNACGCGQFSYDSSGRIVGGTVSLFENTAGASDCNLGVYGYAHELGHVLGLGHASGQECADNIMWPTMAGGLNATNEQCNTVDSFWSLPNEDPCLDEPPPQGCPNGQDPPGSPIVIDLERDGFRFTSPDAGVEFDLDSDGVAERIAWVSDPRDAFLFRDLNGNGSVDDGGELFGNYTVLPDGTRALHGFEALAELDLPEEAGNGDGILDQRDWGYHLLELWIDANLDGISEDHELVGLAESEVQSISLDYLRNRRKDRFGNLLTYWTKVRLVHRGKVLPGWAVDVFFQHPSP